MSEVTESKAQSLAVSFQKAAIGELPWEMALQDFAAATGAHSGELIGFGTYFFNWITNRDPGDFAEFEQIGGYDPRINSRIRIGVRAAELEVLDETAFDTKEICAVTQNTAVSSSGKTYVMSVLRT